MRYALLLVVTLAWGLWFGGTIATFVFGVHLHDTLPYDAFAAAVDAMFGAWSKYQLGVAGVGIVAAGLLMVTYPSRYTIGLVACLLLAVAMAITFGLGLLPVMVGLHRQGMGGTPEFMKWHGRSVVVQTVQAAVLLGTGALLLRMGGATMERTAPTFDLDADVGRPEPAGVG